jgi:hypothetical protein
MRYTWTPLPDVTLDPAYVAWLESTETIVITDLYDCALPRSVRFPHAKTVVAVDFEKYAACDCLRRRHFPSATTIHWLSPRLCNGNEDAKEFPHWVVPDVKRVASNFYVQTPECAACNAYTVTEDAGLRARYLRGGEEPREEEVLVHTWMPREAALQQFWQYCATKQAAEEARTREA